MRAARILLAVVLVGMGLVGVTASPTFACSCVAEGKRAELARADVVFVGTLTDRSQDGDDTTGTVTYTFDVRDVYEGRTVSPVEVTTGVQETACGMPGLTEGETYVIFAAGGGDGLSTGSCSGNAEAKPALVDQLDRLSGPPHEPTAAPAGNGPPPLVTAAAVAAVVAVLAAVVRAVRALLR